MQINNRKILAGALLLMSLGGVSAVPAVANETTQSVQNELKDTTTQESDVFISQLRGHDTYAGEPQIERSDFLIGTVNSIIGDLIFVTLDDGRRFTASASPSYRGARGIIPGSNVLVIESDGRLRLAQEAHPRWILILDEMLGRPLP